MRLKWGSWLYKLGTAAIGGGAGAVVSGVSSIMIAPDTFNLTSAAGGWKVLILMGVNFAVSGFFSMFFYLKTAPLPEIADEDTQAFRKTVERAVAKEKIQEVIRDNNEPEPPSRDKF